MYEQTPLQSSCTKEDKPLPEFITYLENLRVVTTDIRDTVNCINKRVGEFRGIVQTECNQPESIPVNKGLMGIMQLITDELVELKGRLRQIDSELFKVVG